MLLKQESSVEFREQVREVKFVMDCARVPMLLLHLQAVTARDRHYSEGTVSSIYFDSWDLRSLYEKINSDYLKTKVRLRWYHDLSGTGQVTNAYWELKGKIGAKREKLRHETKYEGPWLARMALNDPRLMALPQKLSGDWMPDTGFLLPVLLVRYARRRFVDWATGARMAVDYDIRVPALNPLLFGASVPFTLQQAVVEVKGPASTLPDCAETLRDFGCRRESFSKYGVCCKKAMERVF